MSLSASYFPFQEISLQSYTLNQSNRASMSEQNSPIQAPKPSTADKKPTTMAQTIIRRITSPIINGCLTLLHALLLLILSPILLLLGLIRFIIDAILYFPKAIIKSLLLFRTKPFKALILTVFWGFAIATLLPILYNSIEPIKDILSGFDCYQLRSKQREAKDMQYMSGFVCKTDHYAFDLTYINLSNNVIASKAIPWALRLWADWHSNGNLNINNPDSHGWHAFCTPEPRMLWNEPVGEGEYVLLVWGWKQVLGLTVPAELVPSKGLLGLGVAIALAGEWLKLG
jgi:hypothetical protein